MIPITKPNLPPLEKYVAHLSGIWGRNWLTNNGPLVNELELKLKEYLNLKHLLYVNNGTIALQIAIKALELKGDVITTPFSFVATTSALIWENCSPVFVDIDKDTLTIDHTKIEAAITPQTSAILATHVYGNACAVDEIEAIAKQHNLKVIYDAAHCFGTKYKGKSIFEYGDISATSFHATKLFHTVEGGAVFTSSPELLEKMAFMRNFGYNGPENFECAGINGKSSELHAAMGMCNLEVVDSILESRKLACMQYDHYLKTEKIRSIKVLPDCQFNYAYYPIILESEDVLLKVVNALNGNAIYPRRYFYPSLNNVRFVESIPMPIAEDVSKRVLCLPLYYGISKPEIDTISRIVLRAINYTR